MNGASLKAVVRRFGGKEGRLSFNDFVLSTTRLMAVVGKGRSLRSRAISLTFSYDNSTFYLQYFIFCKIHITDNILVNMFTKICIEDTFCVRFHRKVSKLQFGRP